MGCTLQLTNSYFFCIIFLLFLPNVYTFTINNQNFSVVWDHSNPSLNVFANFPKSLESKYSSTDSIFNVDFDGIDEYHYGDGIHASIAQSITFNTSADEFTETHINEPNNYGVTFNKILSNGAILAITFTINPDQDKHIKIPKAPDNANCSNQTFPGCKCAEEDIIPKNSALKFSFNVTNWPWEPLKPNDTLRLLSFSFKLSGALNLAYYAGIGFGDDFVDHSICDISTVHFNLLNGDVILPFSMYDFYYRDGEPTGLVYNAGLQYEDGKPVLKYQLYYLEFNNSLFYDPNIGVIFPNANYDDYNENGDGISDSSGVPLEIVLPVVLCSVFVLAIITLVALTVMAYKKRKHIRSRLSTMATVSM